MLHGFALRYVERNETPPKKNLFVKMKEAINLKGLNSAVVDYFSGEFFLLLEHNPSLVH